MQLQLKVKLKTLLNLLAFSYFTIFNKELENIKSKVHLIWGSEDKEVPIDIAKEANKKIKKSNLHILEGQGHNPLNSSYVEIVNIINT